MKVKVRKATGVLAELLANIDERELAKTRKRMMLAAKIDEAMKRCGYNQNQFACLMKKSPTVISEWLSGDRNFTIDTLVDIEDALGIRLLDVSIMTVVAVDTEISQKINNLSNNGEIVSMRGTWEFASGYTNSETVLKCV